ncbi:hypothetical protein SAMN04489707_102741 [Paenacidovorax caeni]|uniref:Uncharacterized protein n=1 Tax=Paenacidovorax caeni TaxID=343013 RepID=A0A1I7JKB1_9BURK|nr:hypothetical protein SAMN04489707_102741 [Paenacidovorax caeni]
MLSDMGHMQRAAVCAAIQMQVTLQMAHLHCIVAMHCLFWKQPGQPGQQFV